MGPLKGDYVISSLMNWINSPMKEIQERLLSLLPLKTQIEVASKNQETGLHQTLNFNFLKLSEMNLCCL